MGKYILCTFKKNDRAKESPIMIWRFGFLLDFTRLQFIKGRVLIVSTHRSFLPKGSKPSTVSFDWRSGVQKLYFYEWHNHLRSYFGNFFHPGRLVSQHGASLEIGDLSSYMWPFCHRSCSTFTVVCTFKMAQRCDRVLTDISSKFVN